MFKVTIIWRHESCDRPSSLINRYPTREIAIKEAAEQIRKEWLDADYPDWDVPGAEEWVEAIQKQIDSLRSLWRDGAHEAFIETAEILYNSKDGGELWVEITEEHPGRVT